ncbi:MAG: permease [Melioribacter sp.]|nr:permease [Melioribacter sp.]
MSWKEQYKSLLLFLCFFLFIYFMPIESKDFKGAIIDGFKLIHCYAREHVILCLIPAFFIAGVIAVFISQTSIIKYFGTKAKKWKAYLIASVSGTILAVCSCTVLPLFSSIYKRGAGLGPAIAFLYSGPAINILAIILTARVLGFELGVARIVGAITFSLVIGLIMGFIYHDDEEKQISESKLALEEGEGIRPFWQTSIHFFILIGILVFVNWNKPANESTGFWYFIYKNKWFITSIFGIGFAISMIYIIKVKKIFVILGTFVVIISATLFSDPTIPFIIGITATSITLAFSNEESKLWLLETWEFAKQIMPLLGIGILLSGFLLGSSGNGEGIIPKEWIFSLVGQNSLLSNFFASIVGAFMYFATLTEIPIVQGLIKNGMGKGPALALLLAGPALSLPSMIVIKSVIGFKKTTTYVFLVIIMATLTGFAYGLLF